MAGEEYLPGNWFKGPENLDEIGRTNGFWKIIKTMNKNVINNVYRSTIIALGSYLSNYTRYQLSRQVPYGDNNRNK